MSEYQALADMGIQNPLEISKYTLRQEGIEDVLKIYYNRHTDSYLPNSRKYKFSRSLKAGFDGDSVPATSDAYEISPFLLKAVAELDQIVADKAAGHDEKQEILNEIDHLERVVSMKLAELKRRLSAL
ncbi:MAG TPA: DUF3461 domain-containing protein [Gammaproteobacteria bacterium]|jgi:hypothetical protein|nr:DUF3461 domain-containing protein [Gammaproteobacteria bacterium]